MGAGHVLDDRHVTTEEAPAHRPIGRAGKQTYAKETPHGPTNPSPLMRGQALNWLNLARVI